LCFTDNSLCTVRRAPNLVKPEDHVCERLAPIVYAKCGPSDVDATVEEAIHSLRASLTSVGPFLSKGIILISFFEKREVKGFFGLVNSTENIYFERWRIPVLIDERPLLSPHHQDQYGNGNSSSYGNRNYEAQYKGNTDYYAKDAAESERKYFVDFALQVVQKRLVTILEVIIRPVDHVTIFWADFVVSILTDSSMHTLTLNRIMTRSTMF
jgi:Autophagy-related protein 101